MIKYDYIVDNEEDIYKFAAEVIQIARIADRLGIDVDEYISDLADGGYLDTELIAIDEEAYTLKALAILMDTTVSKYLKKVVSCT